MINDFVTKILFLVRLLTHYFMVTEVTVQYFVGRS